MNNFLELAEKCMAKKVLGTFVVEDRWNDVIRYVPSFNIRKRTDFGFDLKSEKTNPGTREYIARFNQDNSISTGGGFRIICFLENIFIK